MARFLIGVDGGGTGTRAVVADLRGRILGHGAAGPSGLALGIDAAWMAVRDAVAEALTDAGQQAIPQETTIGLGLAGANHVPWAEAFLAGAGEYAQAVLESDGFIALLAAHGGGAGLLLAAGTGSVGTALYPDGRRATAGGWGFPSGDEGSGAWLGLRAVSHAQQVLDGRSPRTPLADRIIGTCGGTGPAVLAWCATAGQGQYASLAPLVFDSAACDPVAQELLDEAAKALARLAQALDPDDRLPVALAGSVGTRLLDRLPGKLRQRTASHSVEPVVGALTLAMHAAAQGAAATS